MADNKTQPTERPVSDFIQEVEDSQKRQDCLDVLDMMREVTGEEPRMWGKSIVGFGSYHYVYASGREGDWMELGFSPRKANLSLYLMGGIRRFEELLEKLGKYKTGKSCLYVKRLDDIDRGVLRELMERSVAAVRSDDIRY